MIKKSQRTKSTQVKRCSSSVVRKKTRQPNAALVFKGFNFVVKTRAALPIGCLRQGCHVFCSSSFFLTRSLYCPGKALHSFRLHSVRSLASLNILSPFRLHSFQSLPVQRLLHIFCSPAGRCGLRGCHVFCTNALSIAQTKKHASPCVYNIDAQRPLFAALHCGLICAPPLLFSLGGSLCCFASDGNPLRSLPPPPRR